MCVRERERERVCVFVGRVLWCRPPRRPVTEVSAKTEHRPSMVVGISKLITCVTPLISIPLPATFVHTRISIVPSFNDARAY
jgi:hypothetical protein